MTHGVSGGYRVPAAAIYPAFDPKAKNPNDQLIHAIKKIIEADPLFSKPTITGNQLLLELNIFIVEGGNPALLIPEIRIGTTCLRNVSCLELLYRIYHYDIEGLDVFWDRIEIGPEINHDFITVIKKCLEKIDSLIEKPHLRVEEIVGLIQCVQASDPYLSNAKKTGERILLLMDKFLKSNGDPLIYISNVRIGVERVDKITVLELVYLIWKHPYEYGAELEDWDYEDEPPEESDDEKQELTEPVNDGPNVESFNNRFKEVINRCSLVINHKLERNLVKDEDFLSLMRCAVEFSEDSESDSLTPDKTGYKFLHLMSYFVVWKVNPNLLFLKIQINGNIYVNATCFQVTYLLWKYTEATWTDLQEEEFQRVFDVMLLDRRTDLTLKFSERNLTAHHFVNSGNIEFYRKQHGTKKKFYTNGEYEPNERVIDQLHGHSLERMTIAHYAVIINDYTMLSRFLDSEPRLLNMTCCMTRGKATVDTSRHKLAFKGVPVDFNSLEINDHISGVISVKSIYSESEHHIQVIRMTNVTLLHLAARVGREGVLACLGSRHPNPAVTDSDNNTPQHYLRYSIMEGIVPNGRSALPMFKALELVTKYNGSTALPEVNKLFHHEGYDLLYNTSRKVAIFAHQRLGKDSFGAESRTNHKWVENVMIPSLNRAADDDFKYTGFDRGHLAAAEDASGSDDKMAATFRLENAVPQNQNINRGAWSRLEAHVRGLALQNDLVEVFTGPLFAPDTVAGVKVIKHEVMGGGEVHVPTHLFKVIFIHNRETTREIYILPNQTNTAKKRFSNFRCDGKLDFIQQHSGILFNQWIRRL